MLSEAVNAYVEVPKTTALRTLVGIMTIFANTSASYRLGIACRKIVPHSGHCPPTLPVSLWPGFGCAFRICERDFANVGPRLARR